MNFSIFEVIMLVCFGTSWPFATIKTIRAKNPAGKSYLFAILILVGYISGCLHKLFYHWDWVFYLYLALFFLVATDTALCLHYAHRLKTSQADNGKKAL